MAQQAQQSEFQTARIPLVGMINTREFDSSGISVLGPTSGVVGVGVVGQMIVGNQVLLRKDQRFINCIPTHLMNELTEKKTYYLVKRPGFQQEASVSAGNAGKYLFYWDIKATSPKPVTAWGTPDSEIFDYTTSLGSISGECIFMLEFTIGTISAFLIQSTDNSLWYHAENMVASFVGTTHTSTTIDSIADTTGLYVGQLITGSGVQADTRITAITSSVAITISLATTTSIAGTTITSAALAKVTDVDYPGNSTLAKTIKAGAVFLDGYIFVMDKDGVVYNSDLNSIVNWTANGSINSNSYPDKGVSLIRYRNLVAAFNTTSIEFFSDAGNPSGTPLINNTQATIKLGAAHAYGICSVEDNLIWVSSSTSGGSSVYMLQDYTPKKISTPIIEQQIALAGADSAMMGAAKLLGRTFVFLILTNNTYVYVVEDKMWHEWDSAHNYWDFLAVSSVGINHVYGISTSNAPGVAGILWKLDVSSVIYTDNSTPYTMTIQTSKVDFDNSFRKRLSKIKIIGDVQVLTSDLNISWSDDDYQTFSTPRTVDLLDTYAYINNCGQFRRRAFRITNTSSSGVRLEAVELDVIQGVN